MDNIETSGNLIEAALWFTVSLTLAVKAVRTRGQGRFAVLLLVAAFALFGMTDLIESETGAWWRPLWLLGLKVLSVAGFVVGFTWYYLAARRQRQE